MSLDLVKHRGRGIVRPQAGPPRLAGALGDADYRMPARLEHTLDVLEQAVLAVQHEGHLRDEARVHHACRPWTMSPGVLAE